MEQKRLNLYQKFRNSAADVRDFDKKYPTFRDWVSINFKNDLSVRTLFDKTIKAKDRDGKSFWGETEESFFKTFACDLLPTSNYCTQEGFPKCASRMGKAETGYLGLGKTYIEYTSSIAAWGKPRVRLYQSSDGKTGPYEILSGTKKGGTGTYSCTSSGATFLGALVMPSTGGSTTPDNTNRNTDNKTTLPVAEKPAATTPAGNQAKIVTKSEKNPYVSGSDAIIY